MASSTIIAENTPLQGQMRGGSMKASARDKSQIQLHPVSFKRVAQLFAPHKWSLLAVILLIVASSLISITQPFIVRDIIDHALPEHDTQLLLKLVAAMVILVVAIQGFGVLQTWIASKVGQRVMHQVRVNVYTNLSRQAVGFFTRTKAGEVQSRLVNDVSGMQGVLTSTATSIASNVTTAIATVIAMVALSPTLSLLSLLVIPPSIWLTRKVALTRREVLSVQQQRVAQMQSQISETLSASGAMLAWTTGSTGRNVAQFSELSHDLIDLHLRSELAGRWRMASMQVIFAAIPAAVYLIAGLDLTGEAISIGTLLAFTTLQTQIFRPLQGLLNVGAQWITSMAVFSRVFEFLDLVPEVPEPENPREISVERADLQLSHVSYRYPDAEDLTLHDVTLSVPSGTTLALVGHTGSGKSTIAQLAARLADPSSGAVTLGGVPLSEFTHEQRSQLISMVSQETYLRHASVRENLLIARPDASDGELWRALELAQVADVIRELPDGLETLVGERGYRFSGGEQQRIAIARAILANTKVLILDEATSALDNQTEAKVQRALETLMADRTTIVIAHRLSTIQSADQIAVVDSGEIVQLGDYESLHESAGAFHDLEEALISDSDSEQITPDEHELHGEPQAHLLRQRDENLQPLVPVAGAA